MIAFDNHPHIFIRWQKWFVGIPFEMYMSLLTWDNKINDDFIHVVERTLGLSVWQVLVSDLAALTTFKHKFYFSCGRGKWRVKVKCVTLGANPWLVTLHFWLLKGTNGRQKTWDLPCLLHLLFWFHMSNNRNFWNNERWKSCIKYFSIMKLFHLQKPFQNGANDMSECLTCETAFCKKAQNFV